MLSVSEAAKRVGKAESTIHRWRREGILEVHAGGVRERDLLRADRIARDRNPASRQTPVVALARDLGIEPAVLREELRAMVMRRK